MSKIADMLLDPFPGFETAAACLFVPYVLHDLFLRPEFLDAAIRNQDDFVCQFQYPLLVRDDDNRCIGPVVHLFESLGQAPETPQVYPGLRLVKDGDAQITSKNGRKLDPLKFSARQRRVNFSVLVVLWAQTHTEQKRSDVYCRPDCGPGLTDPDGQAFGGGLLKCTTCPQPGFIDALVGHILPVKEHLARSRSDDAMINRANVVASPLGPVILYRCLLRSSRQHPALLAETIRSAGV